MQQFHFKHLLLIKPSIYFNISQAEAAQRLNHPFKNIRYQHNLPSNEISRYNFYGLDYTILQN